MRTDPAAWSFSCEDLFQHVAVGASQIFLQLQRKAQYAAGTAILEQGEVSSSVFLIYSGQVVMFACDGRGAVVGLRVAQAGEVLGVPGVLAGEPHEVTAITSVASELGTIERNDFFEFLQEHPAVTFRIIEVLSQKMTVALGQIRSFRRAEESAPEPGEAPVPE